MWFKGFVIYYEFSFILSFYIRYIFLLIFNNKKNLLMNNLIH